MVTLSYVSWVDASWLDRVDEHRSRADWVAQLWQDEDAKLLKVDAEGNFFVNDEGDGLRMTRPFVEYDDQRHILLGLNRENPVFAVEALPDGPMSHLREIGSVLSGEHLEIAAAAVAITNWHRNEKFCPRCGTATRVTSGGFLRECGNCGNKIFPRTDAAAIVAITDPQDRLLLGHQGSWAAKRVSIFAGFVEAGESIEHAIHREMAEETDLTIEKVHYFGSQPWPFPRSLMLGFFAEVSDDHFSVNEDEIQWAQWFTKDELRKAVKEDQVTLPQPVSIAHRMITSWLER